MPVPGLTGGLVDQIGMRVRIAAMQVMRSLQDTFSGEVEDMLVRRVYPPQGGKETGFQGDSKCNRSL